VVFAVAADRYFGRFSGLFLLRWASDKEQGRFSVKRGGVEERGWLGGVERSLVGPSDDDDASENRSTSLVSSLCVGYITIHTN
jgi:hypothetical protein